MRAAHAKDGSPKAARSRPPRLAHPLTPVSRRALEEATHALERAAAKPAQPHYVLRLYVTGTTPASTRAIEKVKSICEQHLQGCYELEVIDIYQMPRLAKDHQIIATPTLIKVIPSPLRRFIGDLSTVDKILFGVDLREKNETK